MKRGNVIDWLNHRLAMTNRKTAHGATDFDVTFIRNYISHYKNKLVDPQTIVEAIRYCGGQKYVNHIDFMINKLILDFNATTETIERQSNDVFAQMINGPNNYTIITKYK